MAALFEAMTFINSFQESSLLKLRSQRINVYPSLDKLPRHLFAVTTCTDPTSP
ncbi:hypothetical protein [Edaphobacter modestus]|uniref:Uncharacterized protein n=1 Tax=Edaphobacter modestus TaxID=388466 RepID=A0A4Q7YTA9_9BACT|nr:hypothetical protein [Edaphobacter modestus]RZU40169.1 hypothetical protein BDD14_1603 [Edaphobacter modestus]